jgi:uncharacterized delta-60 repeat protein
MKTKLLLGLLLTSATAFGQAGANDLTFDPGTGVRFPISTVSDRVLQPDGKILITGGFTHYNGTARNKLARINSDGSLDLTFDPGAGTDGTASTMALQPDGKILIGGTFTSYNGTARRNIARINSDGSLDLSFNPGTGTDGIVATMALQPDGKILIGGNFFSYHGTARRSIARVNSDGSVDPSFDPGTGTGSEYSYINPMALQPDGKILIAGLFSSYDGTARSGLARINSDGSLDLTFSPGTGTDGTGSVGTMALQPDGKILIGGYFTSYDGTARNHLARLNSDGSLDLTFDPGTGTDDYVYTMALQPDGKILIGGNFISFSGITRVNSDGSLDLTFDPGEGTGMDSYVYTMALQPDGKILIGGYFASYDGTARGSSARINSDGSLDPTFDPGSGTDTNGFVYTMALQPDGKILIGGVDFVYYDGTARNHIARVNSDGSLDLSFDPGEGTGMDSYVYTMALQPDGKILIGGSFASYNGTARNGIVRVNSDGSLDPTFDPGTGASGGFGVYGVALQPDGKILIGGDFTTYDGTARNGIARINSDGSLDPAFDPGTGTNANGYVNTMALQPDGKILIGGYFTSYDGTARNGIVQVNSDGSLDPAFDPGTGLGTGFSYIKSMALQPDGKILMGGNFSTYNGTARNDIARVNSDGSLDPAFDPGTGASGGVGFGVNAVALQPDGKTLIGGDYSSYNGTARNRITRINGDGSLDPAFDPGSGTGSDSYSNSSIKAMALQPDGNILIGGYFTSYDGTARSSIARVLGKSLLHLNLTTDAFGSETTWELTNTDNTVVASGGPYSDGSPMAVTETIEVDPGCYKLRVYDAGGNGITDGGYVLSYGNGQRLIDANGEFASLSTTGTNFCFPLGPVVLDPEDCDDTDHAVSDPLTCGALSGAIGYQFWAFDPHGSFQARTISAWPQVGPNRLATLPVDLELNVRVRAMFADSTFTSFGPACTLVMAVPGMAPHQPRSMAVGNEAELHTWPNPTESGQVQLTLGGLDAGLPNVHVHLYDATGRQAFAKELPVAGGNVNSSLALGNLAQGVYLLQVIAGQVVHSTRLVVGK